MQAGHNNSDAHKRPYIFEDWLKAEWFDNPEQFYTLKRKAKVERYHKNYKQTEGELVQFIKSLPEIILRSEKAQKLWAKYA